MIFKESRRSLGYRDLRKRLCNEGFKVSDYGTQKLMNQLGLVVTQRVAYNVTTKKCPEKVAQNRSDKHRFPIHTQLFTQISSSPKRRRAVLVG